MTISSTSSKMDPELPATAEVAKNLEVDRSRDLFCQTRVGSILHVVQMAKIFEDSKTFVDMTMKRSPEEIQRAFQNMVEGQENPSKSAVERFVWDNFSFENQMEKHVPVDWQPSPRLLSRISDRGYAEMASSMNDRWKVLCRKVRKDVEVNPDRHSLLYLPHPVIVPGGRFREIYYWDTYWVIRGLIQCEMFESVKGILLNFVHLIKQFGKIPNGGRTYFLNRSQPPMFIQMVLDYVNATQDISFVVDNIEHLEREFLYWHDHHSVTVANHTMFRYFCDETGPRPESYCEDFELAQTFCTTDEERTALYREMKTGAETGWDYSSRWFVAPDGSNNGSLDCTKARSVVPVDLNSILAQNADILSRFFDVYLMDLDKTKAYSSLAFRIKKAIEEVNQSNFWPLWSTAYDVGRKNEFTSRAVKYLKAHCLDSFAGGVPTTLLETGEQWDFPNCWPPLEHMLVKGLANTDIPEAKSLAYKLALKRVHGCYLNFVEKGHMFEKYDATSTHEVGGGGEYEVQIGFGWTNGVVLDFLDMYHFKRAADTTESEKL